MRMNDDAELFGNNNEVTRRDSTYCLEEYAAKLKWKNAGERILDIGSADGSVTSILIKHVPKGYGQVVGCDINENMVEFANVHYGDDRVKFIVLNIEGDLPEELREGFDHVFSFYTLHWIQDQEKGFTNIYNLLSEGGECLLLLVGHSPMHSVFQALSRTSKWASWLQDVDKFVSPYHNCQNPDDKIARMLKKIGFKDIDVRCKQKVNIFDGPESLKGTITSVNPFNIPKDIHENFLDDYVKMARDMRIVDQDTSIVKLHYNLIVIHCRK